MPKSATALGRRVEPMVMHCCEEIRVTRDELKTGFMEYSCEHTEDAIKLMAGLFVGLMKAYAELNGADPDKEIRLEAIGGARDITIHAAA